MNFYNEHDHKAAAWLRELIEEGHIAPGIVDERDIQAIRPDELRGFVQCHFFAGIGGWSHALRLAGWPEDEAVWTGSCPCQPFSSAGKAGGVLDARHLWPAFRGLIAECRPAIVFGEQVASKDGRAWLAGVRSDLEGDGYAVGAADLCAAGVGAPHIRQRLFWVADVQKPRLEGRAQQSAREECAALERSGANGRLADSGGVRLDEHAQQHGQPEINSAHGNSRGPHADGCREPGGVGNSKGGSAGGSGAWSDFDLLPCRDGKARRVEPGTFCVVDGLSIGVDALWHESIQNIKAKVIHHATATKTSPGEILQPLRRTLLPQFLQWRSGRPDRIQAETVLFAAVCELQRQLGTVLNGEAPGGEQGSQPGVRELRQEAKPASPSPGWEFSEQCQAELANLVRELSQEVASIGKEIAPMIFHGYPLAHGVSGRVGLLRGYGNAIVPQVAAEFIQAYRETLT